VVNRICFEARFISENPSPECGEDPPIEGFEVRFYEDAFGIPGAELTGSPGSNFTIDRTAPTGVDSHTWRFSGAINPPDGLAVVEGDCYWIELTAGGLTDCSVAWPVSLEGNEYAAHDTNGVYEPDDITFSDTSFCIDSGIIPASGRGVGGACGGLPVACCMRGGGCEEMLLSECGAVGGVDFAFRDCGSVTCPLPLNDDCENATVICEGDVGEWVFYDGLLPSTRLGQCDKWPGWPFGPGFGPICDPMDQTSCTDPPNIPYTNNMCYPWGYNPDGSAFKPAYECIVNTDNRLATTDGPPAAGDCFDSGENSFQADVWHRITAPCYGTMVITMCRGDREFDSMLAVFTDCNSEVSCPGGSNENLIACNDDYCMGSATTSGVSTPVRADFEYLLRVGGRSATGTALDASQGLGELHIGALCKRDYPISPSELPYDPEHRAPKHRYLSIDPRTNPTLDTVIKVELFSMKRCSGDLRRACSVSDDCPSVCEDDNDATCENAGQCGGSDCIPTGPCVEHPDVGASWIVQQPIIDPTGGCKKPGCPPEFYPEDPYCCETDDWMAYLGDTVPDLTGGFTYWADVWKALPAGVLHIAGCPIVPAATYAISNCDPNELSICNDPNDPDDPCWEGEPWGPLLIATQPLPFTAPGTAGSYGDIAGGTVLPGPTVLPPDGYVNVEDLQVMLLTIVNYGGYNLPQAHPTWVDLHGLGPGSLPNYVLNVSDLQQVMFGLLSHPWSQYPGNLQPGQCP
jgi:hypothetical protein